MGSWDIIVMVMTKPNTWGAIGVTTMGITMVINPQKMGYVAATKTLLTPLIGGTPPPHVSHIPVRFMGQLIGCYNMLYGYPSSMWDVDRESPPGTIRWGL